MAANQSRLGVEKFTDGDHVGMTVAGGGGAGDAVQVTGDREVTVVGTADADVHGVLSKDADAGEEVMVNLHGAYYTSVAAGTTAGTYLTASATAGELRGINTGGATGETAQLKQLLTLTDEVNGESVVLLQ
jgi:hypothetical protein